MEAVTGFALISRQTSKPSMSGSRMSSRTTSDCSASRSPSAPVAASSTSKPASRSVSTVAKRTISESSTTRAVSRRSVTRAKSSRGEMCKKSASDATAESAAPARGWEASLRSRPVAGAQDRIGVHCFLPRQHVKMTGLTPHQGATMTPAIDVHTHMLNRDWLELLRAHGRPRYEVRPSLDAPGGHLPRRRAVHDAAAGALRLPVPHPGDGRGRRRPGHHLADLPQRVLGRARGQPQGGPDRQRRHGGRPDRVPSRIRWLCSLPWEYPEAAVEELARGRRPGRGRGHGARQRRRPDPDRPAVRAGLVRHRPARPPGPDPSDGAARHARDGAARVQPDRQHRLHVRHQPGGRPPDLRRVPGPVPRSEADRRRTPAARCPIWRGGSTSASTT